MKTQFSKLKYEILNPTAKISDILRMAKVLAHEINNRKFINWVNQELNGYDPKGEIPEYRKGKFNNYGQFTNGAWYYKKAHIPSLLIEKELGKDSQFIDTQIYEAVASLEELLENDTTPAMPWPGDLVALMQTKLYQGYVLQTAWLELPRGFIVGLIDSIKNRLLDFLIEIEKQYPRVRDQDHAIEKIPESKVNTFINTTIYGNDNKVVVGKEVNITVKQNDLTSLKLYLQEIGVTKELVRGLEKIINTDKPNKKNKTFGGSLTKWIGTLSTAAFTQGLNVATPLVIEALQKYYGW